MSSMRTAISATPRSLLRWGRELRIVITEPSL
jgi:hypothetical protein